MTNLCKAEYHKLIDAAKTHSCGKVYPLAMAEGVQDGDIFIQKDSCVFWTYTGFAYITGSTEKAFLDDVYSLMTDKNKPRRFVLMTDDEIVRSYFAEKENIDIQERNLYQFAEKKDFRLPEGYTIKEMDENILNKLSGRIVPSLFWPDRERFLEKGKGYCVMKGDNIASWAFSAAVTSEEIDIGIETAEEYKNKGLGKIAANAMIKYVIEQGKAPVWACHHTNIASNKMAQSLGFVKIHRCYVIKPE